MFDFLYDISTVWLAIYCVLFFVGVMWFGIVFVRPFLKILIGREPGVNDLVFYTTSGFSLFYGLLLGLLAVAACQNLEQVRQNVFGEASSLASLYRDASLYPEPIGSELRELLRDYTLYVIYKDWPAHRRGRIYNGGTNRLTMIEYTVLELNPENASQEILQSQTLQEFGDFVEARQRRLDGVGIAIPGVLWYVVAVGAFVNLVLIWMLRMRFFTHIILGMAAPRRFAWQPWFLRGASTKCTWFLSGSAQAACQHHRLDRLARSVARRRSREEATLASRSPPHGSEQPVTMSTPARLTWRSRADRRARARLAHSSPRSDRPHQLDLLAA
jgi:Protein of unknown function (DUF4239)